MNNLRPNKILSFELGGVNDFVPYDGPVQQTGVGLMSRATELAHEIRDLILDRLARPQPPLPEGTLVTRDKQFVAFLCYYPNTEADEYPLECWSAIGRQQRGDPKAPLAWNEFLTDESSRLPAVASKAGLEGDIVDNLCRETYQQSLAFRPVLRQLGVFPTIDDVLICAVLAQWSRLLGDKAGPIPRLILQTLEAGGIPCGFEGDKPDGRLIVYWPHEVSPDARG